MGARVGPMHTWVHDKSGNKEREAEDRGRKEGFRNGGEGEKWKSGGGIPRRCMEEISRNERGCKIEWVEERRKFFEERGYAPGEVERRVAGGYEMRTELELRDKEIQEQEIEGRIRGGRFNGWFKEVRVGGLPRYLKKKGKEEKKIRVARYRLGNEMRGERYWMGGDANRCRICGWEQESWERVLERCSDGGRGGGAGKSKGNSGGRRVWGAMDEESGQRKKGRTGKGKGGEGGRGGCKGWRGRGGWEGEERESGRESGGEKE